MAQQKQYSVAELANMYRKEMASTGYSSSIEGKSDDEIVYDIMQVQPDDPILIQPASTTTDVSQVPVNIEVEKNGVEQITENASTNINPADGSNIESPSDTSNNAPIKFDYENYLNPDNEVEGLVIEELNSVHTDTIVEQDNQLIDLKTKNVYKKEEDGSLTKTYQLSDKDFGEVQANINSGAVVPVNNTEFNSTVSDSIDEEDTRENFESDEKRGKLVAKNEPIVRTKVDSLIKDGEGFMPVTLAKSAATQFESAYDELETNGIQLQIADSKRGHESQMLAHQNWVQQGKKGPVIAHPDMSFHTIGYAIDLAQNEEMKGNIDTISEVMRRHGWRQHPDEWWHFSLNDLPETRKTQEQVEEIQKTIDLADEMENIDYSLSLPSQPSLSVMSHWQGNDTKWRIIDRVGYAGAKDLIYQGNQLPFISFTQDWNEEDWSDPVKAQEWIIRDIPEEDLEMARINLIVSTIKEWDAEDEKIALDKWARLHYPEYISKAERGFGDVAWDRVFGTALDQSLSGMLLARSMGHDQFLVSGTNQMLVDMGIIPEMNWMEYGLAGAISMMMPVDALTFGLGGFVGELSYKKALKLSVMSKARHHLINKGYVLGQGPGKINLNKVMSAVLKPGLGNSVARSSVGFGFFDGTGAGLQDLASKAPDKVLKDSKGNIVFDKDGKEIRVLDENAKNNRYYHILKSTLDGMFTGTLLAVSGSAIGTPISQKVQKRIRRIKIKEGTKLDEFLGSGRNPEFLNWLIQKTGNISGTALSEYPLFTYKSYADALESERQAVREELNREGVYNPSDTHIDGRIDKGRILRQQAINTASFLFVLKNLHAPAPYINAKLQTAQQKQSRIENWVIKAEEIYRKNPNEDIGDVLVKMAIKEGINLNAIDIPSLVMRQFTNQPLNKDGTLVINEALKQRFPEYRVRDLASRLKLDPKKSYEELLHEIFLIESKREMEVYEKEYDRFETNQVATREGHSERKVEEIEATTYNIVRNPDRNKSAKQGEQLVLELTESGFSSAEAMNKVRKVGEKVKEDIVNESALEELKNPKKKPKKQTRKQRKKQASKEKKKTDATKEKLDKVDEIVKTAEDKIKKDAEKTGKLIEESTIESKPEEKQVKGVADLKKPYGAKPISEKELFANEAEFQAWKDNLKTSAPHMQLSILYKPVKAGKHKGKIHAQAFEKEITKKVLRTGVSRTINIADRLRYKEDKRIQELRYRRANFDSNPEKVLKDFKRNPQEKLETYLRLYEQVEILEGTIMQNQKTGEIVSRTGRHAIVEAHRLAELKDKELGLKSKSNSTKLLENSIKEYDRVIELCWREINAMSSNPTLATKIKDKLSYLSKQEGGFLDWSERKPGTFQKSELEKLREDLKRDLKEYAIRYFETTDKTVETVSASDMAEVMSKEFGLPKNTIRKWAIQPENWKRIKESLVAHHANRIREAVDEKRINNEDLQAMKDLEDRFMLSQVGPTKTNEKGEKIWEDKSSIILDTYKDPLIAKEMLVALGQLDASPFSIKVDEQGVLKFQKILESVDGSIHNYYEQLHNSIANKENTSDIHEIVTHLPHLWVYAKWNRDKRWLELQDQKTPEGIQEALRKFQIAEQAQKFILSKNARTMKAVQESHNIIEDGKILERIFKNANVAFTPEVSEMIKRDLAYIKDIKMESFWNLKWLASSMGMLAELNRNMLLGSLGAGSKAVVGNTLSWSLNRMSEIPRNIAYRVERTKHHNILRELDDKYPNREKNKKEMEAYNKEKREEFARYNNTSGLGWEWYQNEGYKTAFMETYNRQMKEFAAIMRETPTIRDEKGNIISTGFEYLNPNREKDLGKSVHIPGGWIGGKALRIPQNLMGALDNIVRMPMLLGEYERLVWHHATYEWRDTYGNKVDLPDPKNANHRSQMEQIVAGMRDNPNHPYHEKIWNSANNYASKIVFQDAFYWEFMKNLNDMRIGSGKTPANQMIGHAFNILMPFVLTGINAVKMGYEYSPTSFIPGTPGFMSFMSDLDYGTQLKRRDKETGELPKFIVDPTGFSHNYRRFSELQGDRALAEKEVYTIISKKIFGALATSMIAQSWMKYTSQEDSILELQEDLWAHLGSNHAMAPEARAVLQAYGVQAYGLPIPEGNPLAPGGGSLTARGYDPAWAMITQYPQLVKGLEGIKKVLQGETVEGGKDLGAAWADFYKQVYDTLEESPFLIFFDRVADMHTSRESKQMAETFFAKVASNFFNPSTLGTLNRMREEVYYKKHHWDDYTEDGLSYGELLELFPGSVRLDPEIKEAYLDGKPSLFFGKFFEEGDMFAMEEALQLIGVGKWDEKTGQFVDTQKAWGSFEDIREEIKFPYTTVPLYRLNRHTAKYPVLTIFGDTIPLGDLRDLWGIKIVERTLDPKSKRLTEEYMWLMNEKAQAKDVFGSDPSQSITVALLDGSDEEWGVRTSGGSDFRGTLKFDREQEWSREKMIGDLFKEKLHQIVGENKGPLGTAYAKLRLKIADLDKQIAETEDTRSDDYKMLVQAKRKATLDISNIWNRTAKSIRHLVDFTVFGEERHNMKFWAEYMQAYEMDPEGLRLEFEALYPDKSPDQIDKLVNGWNIAFNMPPEPNREKNIVFNEVYRRWRKKHGVDTEHWNDPENLHNLSRGLVGKGVPKGFKGIDVDVRNVIDGTFKKGDNRKQKVKKKFQPEGYEQDFKGGYILDSEGNRKKKKPIRVKRPPTGKVRPKIGIDAKRKIQILDDFKIKDKDFLFKQSEIKEAVEAGEDGTRPKYPVISKLSEY